MRIQMGDGECCFARPDPVGFTALLSPRRLYTVENNLRLPGQYYDRETGLHYNYFRDYDPGTGRYVEADPIGIAGGLNVYAYVGGNPLSYADPLGLNPVAGAEIGFGVAGPPGAVVGGIIGTGIILMSPSGQRAIKSITQKIGDMCEEDGNEDKCKKKWKLEEDLCGALALQWGRQGVKLCKDSAFIRYSECLRFGPGGVTTPLHGVDTPF